MFIAKKEFERSLAGKAIYLHGTDKDGWLWDAYALIKTVNDDCITVVLDTTETESLSIDDFETGTLSMEVWERGTEDE
ncbi:hypothetical protein ERICIV_00873 [Paenibacillus larvae subsp. larvae]|uniref:Uncharacterized protein n=1 Tax=Paenibacillus larvae subsp. larvae TaxID=147375 RepID=A0A2L1UA95_9BACL|nr:hypothetical protein [Paenibacillus larvae]AQT85675.1 hypothetical protein B1222_16710 [Paenibacillus larvae subsp. pulvifaciens]AVF25077.1 hypothetical protein ERICIII_00870 [Paenibacillus larvae subsp. larvae]AVF29841.1 hypothetical protein ERICIV_00873 [Paenibacillus larvae subsp. larvae]MBH0341219.1 hypothetical protein [Paenibacillus larvae]MCY7522361.1 hypothetical protein [Paenibacillus larvae]